MADRPAFLTHPSALSLQPSPDALSLPEWNGPRSRSRTRTGSPAGSSLRPADRALPADAPGRRVRRQGLGNLPAEAPQPMDRRTTADVREDLVGGSDRGGARQEGLVVSANPARPADPGRPIEASHITLPVRRSGTRLSRATTDERGTVLPSVPMNQRQIARIRRIGKNRARTVPTPLPMNEGHLPAPTDERGTVLPMNEGQSYR